MKKTLPAVLCLLLVGCASAPSQKLSTDVMSSLQGKKITLVQHESPSFVAMTAGKGMFAVAGVGAAAIAGNKFVKDMNIEDPAGTIGQAIAADLSSVKGVELASRTPVQASSQEVGDVVALANGSAYVLDVATHGWSYIYDGFKFSKYHVGYSSKLRLIDVRTSKVVANGLCNYNAKKAGKSAVSHDELVANDAAYVKRELADAASVCIRQFRTDVIGSDMS